MKRIRLTFCILFAILIFLCNGCGFFGDQKYICEATDVESVQIISLDKFIKEEYRYEYTVLCEITDSATFVEQLNSINHKVNWGEPSQLDIGYVVIRVGYINGDFDLLYPNAQCFNRSGKNQYGYFFFDKDQFDSLILDYWPQ